MQSLKPPCFTTVKILGTQGYIDTSGSDYTPWDWFTKLVENVQFAMSVFTMKKVKLCSIICKGNIKTEYFPYIWLDEHSFYSFAELSEHTCCKINSLYSFGKSTPMPCLKTIVWPNKDQFGWILLDFPSVQIGFFLSMQMIVDKHGHFLKK